MENTSAFMSLPSFSLYRLSLNFIKALLMPLRKRGITYNVCTSDPSPETPKRVWSLILNTLWKLVSMVMSWVESLVSVAMATQFLPDIATIELPL